MQSTFVRRCKRPPVVLPVVAIATTFTIALAFAFLLCNLSGRTLRDGPVRGSPTLSAARSVILLAELVCELFLLCFKARASFCEGGGNVMPGSTLEV